MGYNISREIEIEIEMKHKTLGLELNSGLVSQQESYQPFDRELTKQRQRLHLNPLHNR